MSSLQDLMTHRVGMHKLFFKIAKEHHDKYQKLESDFISLSNKIVNSDDAQKVLFDLQDCYEEMASCAVITITFAVMCLEAFFYDLGASKLGDRFVLDNLDKLDIKSKFLVYPKLICGQSPNKSHVAYERLSKLVKLRNELIHFKSKPFELEHIHKASEFHDDLNMQLKEGVKNSIICIKAVMKTLDNLIPNSAFENQIDW